MSIIEFVYQRLTGDKANSDSDGANNDKQGSRARRNTASAFLLQLLAQFLTKIGDGLSSTKIVLPWVLAQVGAPIFFSGLLVPVRESASLLPQLAIGSWVAKFARRKWFYVFGCLLQGVAILAIAGISLTMSGLGAGVAIITLVIVFGLARGLCSVVSKDVLGKTIAKHQRGKLTGLSASCAGLVTIAVAAAIVYRVESEFNVTLLLIGAGLSWWLAALLFGAIVEPAGDVSEGEAQNSFLSHLGLLKSDKPFRQFVIVRSLLMSAGLSAPYFILLAQSQPDSQWLSLGLFMLVSGLASLVSGFIWGRFADKSSRKLLCLLPILLALLFIVTGVLALLSLSIPVLWLVGLFFLLSVLHQGVRVGRKTFVVNLGEGNKRTYYVAVSNTMIGLLLLLVGLVSAVIAQASVGAVLLFFAVTSIVAAIMAPSLPEV